MRDQLPPLLVPHFHSIYQLPVIIMLNIALIANETSGDVMSSAATQIEDRLLRLPDVIAVVGVSRPTLYRMIKNGAFPKPLKQGCISSWPSSQVQTYIQGLTCAG